MIVAKPMSEQECQEANLIPKGIYPFEVLRTNEKVSPKVGSFLSLKINVALPGGKFRNCFDALFFTEGMMWKTRHFYRAVDKMDIYDSGNFLAENCDYAQGYLEIDHRVRKDNGEIESYVKDYITPEKPVEKKEEPPFFDDDINI